MTTEQIVSWGIQVGIALFVLTWGRAQKQTDALIAEKVGAIKDELEAAVAAQEKMLVLQFAVRDQQLLAIHDRLDKAGQKTSDEANRTMGKINALDHRMIVIETRLTRHSPP